MREKACAKMPASLRADAISNDWKSRQICEMGAELVRVEPRTSRVSTEDG